MRINGNTYTAEVDSDERLKVNASAHNPAAIAAEKQDAYKIVISTDPGAADADFFYLKNTSEKNLYIHRISLFIATGATGVTHKISIKTSVTGSPTAGTPSTVVNLYAGGKAADVTAEYKAGDMALTGGNTVDVIRYEPAVTEIGPGEVVREFDAPIILPPNTALVFNNDVDPVAVGFDMTVTFYFRDK